MTLFSVKVADFLAIECKIFVGNFIFPANFREKHINSDKMSGRILEKRPKFGHCLTSWNEKKPLISTQHLGIEEHGGCAYYRGVHRSEIEFG